MSALRLLFDQMIDALAAKRVSKKGHDVVRVADLGLAEADDAEIIDCAICEQRILVTLDEDFGDWAVLPLSEHPGVVRLKVDPTTTDNILDRLFPFLERNKTRDFTNQLVIVKSTGIRWITTA